MEKLSYETCKKLKDAGFPQGSIRDERPDSWVCHEGEYCAWQVDNSYIYVPLLEELIEWCGKCLSHIKQLENGRWFAVSHCGHEEHEISGNNLEESGATPKEAVAHLGLSLNSIKNQ